MKPNGGGLFRLSPGKRLTKKECQLHSELTTALSRYVTEVYPTDDHLRQLVGTLVRLDYILSFGKQIPLPRMPEKN